MGFARQEYWSGSPFSSPADLPDQGIEPVSPALTSGFFTSEPPRKHNKLIAHSFRDEQKAFLLVFFTI